MVATEQPSKPTSEHPFPNRYEVVVPEVIQRVFQGGITKLYEQRHHQDGINQVDQVFFIPTAGLKVKAAYEGLAHAVGEQVNSAVMSGINRNLIDQFAHQTDNEIIFPDDFLYFDSDRQAEFSGFLHDFINYLTQQDHDGNLQLPEIHQGTQSILILDDINHRGETFFTALAATLASLSKSQQIDDAQLVEIIAQITSDITQSGRPINEVGDLPVVNNKIRIYRRAVLSTDWGESIIAATFPGIAVSSPEFAILRQCFRGSKIVDSHGHQQPLTWDELQSRLNFGQRGTLDQFKEKYDEQILMLADQTETELFKIGEQTGAAIKKSQN